MAVHTWKSYSLLSFHIIGNGLLWGIGNGEEILILGIIEYCDVWGTWSKLTYKRGIPPINNIFFEWRAGFQRGTLEPGFNENSQEILPGIATYDIYISFLFLSIWTKFLLVRIIPFKFEKIFIVVQFSSFFNNIISGEMYGIFRRFPWSQNIIPS